MEDRIAHYMVTFTPQQWPEAYRRALDDEPDHYSGHRGEPQREEEGRYYNSAITLGPEGRVVDVYDKHHLVPFGEYMPAAWFFSHFEIGGLAQRAAGGYAALLAALPADGTVMASLGMGEEGIVEIARRLDAGETVRDLRDMRGVAFALGDADCELLCVEASLTRRLRRASMALYCKGILIFT